MSEDYQALKNLQPWSARSPSKGAGWINAALTVAIATNVFAPLHWPTMRTFAIHLLNTSTRTRYNVYNTFLSIQKRFPLFRIVMTSSI